MVTDDIPCMSGVMEAHRMTDECSKHVFPGILKSGDHTLPDELKKYLRELPENVVFVSKVDLARVPSGEIRLSPIVDVYTHVYFPDVCDAHLTISEKTLGVLGEEHISGGAGYHRLGRVYAHPGCTPDGVMIAGLPPGAQMCGGVVDLRFRDHSDPQFQNRPLTFQMGG